MPLGGAVYFNEGVVPPMSCKACLKLSLLMVALSSVVSGCRGSDRQDTLISSVANATHTWRATVLMRQGFVDGRVTTSPTTYVLLDKDSGKPNYRNGVEFKDSEVVMKPEQCGPLQLSWPEDHVLKVTCVNCGLALSGAGAHANAIGSIRIEYEGFPERSSWEPGQQPQ